MNKVDLGACTFDQIAAQLEGHSPNTTPSDEAERQAAVAMILRPCASGGMETLFMKRVEHPRDPWSGQMSFPGGRREVVDATLQDVARRETEEEVGIPLVETMGIGRLHDVYGGRLAEHRLSVSPFVFHHPSPPEVRMNEEVADTVWVPLRYLGSPANVEPYVFHLDPSGREFPSFTYEGYTVWGLTYRIVASFVQLFGTELPGETDVTDVE